MKILMYADGFGVGTQTFITQDVKYLSQKHEIFFICTTIPNRTEIPNVTVKKIPYKHGFIQRKLWQYDIKLNYRNIYFKTAISEIINTFKPDIIHCQFGIEALKFIDNLEDNSIPVCIQFRGYDASSMLGKKSYVKRLQEILNRKNYYSIFVADSLRKNLSQYNINTSKSMILHSGIDLDKFNPLNEINYNDTFTFLQVSSLNQKKGHEYTLHAFSQFLLAQKHKNYKLVLTGDGPRKKILMNLVKELNIEKHVQFVGFVSHDKAIELMRNANVFIHHCITPENGDQEGIPNAIMEAMAMELPVLSTYHSGIPELVTNEKNGYLVKEKDIQTYAQRMSNIIKWERTSKNREVIEKKFEIGKHIQKLESFYEKMLHSSRNIL